MAPPDSSADNPAAATAVAPPDAAATPATEVKIGPDLNVSKAPLDKKLYRQILLPNGLRAVLIQDTTAFQHQDVDAVDVGDSSDGDDEDSDGMEEDREEEKSNRKGKNNSIDGDDNSNDNEDEDEEDDDNDPGLRDAAASLLVGAGSMYDPVSCQGLAHFLEHLLFMGSQKYPGENDYEAFIAKHGGHDNAWTEWECTTYHLEIPQDYLWPALDRLAQFFIAPLLSESAVDRELRSIDSEFQLNKNSDGCRWQQLLCATADPSHPMAKFSWGNLISLKEMPSQQGVDPLEALKTFYDAYYYAANMRLVVCGAYRLDEMEKKVVSMFSSIPALPRTLPTADSLFPLAVDPSKITDWDAEYNSPCKYFGSPLTADSLQKIYRLIPIKDRHSVCLTWPLPPQMQNWKSKPVNFLGHLLGHEAAGSVLSFLKKKSWAVSVEAGMSEDGAEHASCHGLFTFKVVLSEEGLSEWRSVVTAVYQYIGMLRMYAATSWPEWIYEELRRINEVSYLYTDELSPSDVVECISEDMAPHYGLPPDRLLDGSSLLFEFNAGIIKDLLDTCFTPENARIDLTSSSFGRSADYKNMSKSAPSNETDSVSTTTIQNLIILKESSDGSFDPAIAGPPQMEPMFGTLFWCHALPSEWIQEWANLAQPQQPSLPISLPPQNPFVPTKFDLKPLPENDAHHPLLNSSLKLCISVGKTKQWFPATVIQYNRKTNAVLLSYEDEEEQWHTLDHTESELSTASANNKVDDQIVVLTRDFEGTMDKKKIKYRIVALAKPGQGAVRKFGDDSDFDVEDGKGFPPIPPVLPACRLPKQIADSNVLKMWHLQDRNYHRPTAELRLQIICAQANASPLHRACADLMVKLCRDALTETSYLADVCELGSSISSTDIGFGLRFHGFDDKLLDLFKSTMDVLLSFCGQADSLPDTIQEGRFSACLEVLRRNYTNKDMAASDLSASVRLRALRPTIWSEHLKLQALQDIDVASFTKITSSILDKLAVEALYHGNADKSDAEHAKQLILDMLNKSGSTNGLARKNYPSQSVLIIPFPKSSEPSSELPSSSPSPWNLTVPSKDPDEPNTAVEVYIQVGKDKLEDRVLIDLLVHMMDEPLYDQLRTKEQFGYHVSIASRWTHGVMGICVQVVTATHAADTVWERLQDFWRDWRQTLVDQSPADFVEHLAGLATQKLERFDALPDETDALWDEIVDGRFEWQAWRDEAVILRTLTKERVLKAFDTWIQPTVSTHKRRILVVRVIAVPTATAADAGAGADAAGTAQDDNANDSEVNVSATAVPPPPLQASQGRPEVAPQDLGDYVDAQVTHFAAAVCKHQSWGRVNSKLF